MNINAKQIKELGLAALKYTLYLNFNHVDNVDYIHYICVLQAAQAAELLIKAKIVEIDKGAIYEKNKKNTIAYSKLKDKLPQISEQKYQIKDEDLFTRFGIYRNDIQHLRIPEGEIDLKLETMKFLFKVIDPLIYDFWEIKVLDFIPDEEMGWDGLDEFIFEDLIKANIPFRCPDSRQKSYKKVHEILSIVKEATEYVIKNYSKEFLNNFDNRDLINRDLREKFEDKSSYRKLKTINNYSYNKYLLLNEVREIINNEIRYENWGV